MDKILIAPDGSITTESIASSGVITYNPVATQAYATTAATDASSAAILSSATIAARTATVDGLTTGIVANNTSGTGVIYVEVTSANAAHMVTLPDAMLRGSTVYLHNGATAYELRTDAPAAVEINGGTGASATSTVAASTVVMCLKTLAGWLCQQIAVDGAMTKLDAAS